MNTKQFSAHNKSEILLILKDLDQIEADLILVFSDKSYLADQEIESELKKVARDIPFLGCSTSGGIMGATLLDSAFIINFIQFEHTIVKKASVSFSETGESMQAGKELAEALMAPDLTHIFVLSDGCAINGSRLVEGINSVITHEVTVSGGLAGDNNDFNYTLVSDQDNAFKKNVVSAVGLYGNRVRIHCGAFGGWQDFGIERTITKSIENIVYEIDNKPALELYKTYLGEKAKDLPASGLLFPLSLQQDDQKEPLVRTILNINAEEKSLIFAGNIPQGSKVKLMKTGSDNLINQFEIDEKMSEFKNTDEENGLVIMISCIGRKLVMKQLTQEEIEAVTEMVTSKFKFTGFYSYGEIFTNTKNRVYSQVTDAHAISQPIVFQHGDCVLNNQSMTITSIIEF